jgi:hypothetical protein
VLERRFIEEVINQQNLAAADELVAEDVVELDPFPGQEPGCEGLKGVLGMLYAAFPDQKWTIEVGFFRHEMNLKEVVAFFDHEDDAEHAIALRGEPQETEPPSGGIKFSGVSLRATVPAEAAPGVYRFRRLEAETYKGQRVPFDSDTQERWGRWRFLVREEPDTPPTF